MSEYPTIKATDIRVGDTIQWKGERHGIRAIYEMTASRVEVRFGSYVSVSNGQLGRAFGPDDLVELVDRPAPQLPTEPGRLVYIDEYDGEKVEPPILAFLDVFGFWNGARRFPGSFDHVGSLLITKWSPATVTKATSTIEKDSL